jgi:excisionase family DNA binding protein
MQPPESPDLLTLEQAGKRLTLSVSAVRKLITDGHLCGVWLRPRSRRGLRVRAADLAAYLDSMPEYGQQQRDHNNERRNDQPD